MTKEDLIRKLCRSKLWAALAGFVGGLMIYFGSTETEAAAVGGIIMSFGSVVAYIFAEGWIDAAREGAPTYIVDDEAHPPEEDEGNEE